MFPLSSPTTPEYVVLFGKKLSPILMALDVPTGTSGLIQSTPAIPASNSAFVNLHIPRMLPSIPET